MRVDLESFEFVVAVVLTKINDIANFLVTYYAIMINDLLSNLPLSMSK